MKRNLKEEKGITLVALIITIIVLLILAVVTISAVNEGSLFAHANNAAKTYSEAQEKENKMIADYLTELKKHDNGSGNNDNNSSIIGKWYYYGNIGNDEYAINITSTTVTGGYFDRYTDVKYSLDGNVLTITYKKERNNEYVDDYKVFYIVDNKFCFFYDDENNEIDDLFLVKDNAENIDCSLLNGTHFTVESVIWTISNEGVLTLSDSDDEEWTYICYNGKAYLYDMVFTINYNEQNEPISLTSDTSGNTYVLEANS